MELSLIVRAIIKKRRTTSPDHFNGKPVDKQIVQEILDAANWAPNHKTTEPWRLFIFEPNKVKNFGKLHAQLYKEHTPENNFLEKKYQKLLHRADKASHVIVVGMSRSNVPGLPEQEEVAAVACAIQNMLLVATSHNVACFWGTGGMCYHPSFKYAFGLEDKDLMLGFIFLGKTDNDDLEDGKRHSSIGEKIKWM
ncbi:MAG: nitroreductase [Chitinophagales bacterium]|nr:nitroreductase [Chitinophagales bacterium]MCZ2394796.1 nitroreductase [Chitinophagales bacterium]